MFDVDRYMDLLYGKFSALERKRLDALYGRMQAQIPQDLFADWLVLMAEITQPYDLSTFTDCAKNELWRWLLPLFQWQMGRLIAEGKIIVNGTGKEAIVTTPRRMAPQLRPSERFAILTRDNHRCQICGAKASDNAELHVDHITARSKGGTNDRSNLWTLCYECNIGKGTQDL